jgi:spore coat protein U-like protein
MKKILIAAALLASSSAAMAGTTAGNVTVTATVGANCILTTVPIVFGVYDPLSLTPKTGTGQVQLVCTVGATPTVAMDAGLNVTGVQRRMISGGTNFLNYEVFQPTTNAAGAACSYVSAYLAAGPAFALTAAPTTASRSYNVCGQIPAGQSAPNGSYTDTLTATITF